MNCRDPEAPVTSRQTFALKCCTGKDFRQDIAALNINREQFSEIISQCNTVKNAGGNPLDEAERLLAMHAC